MAERSAPKGTAFSSSSSPRRTPLAQRCQLNADSTPTSGPTAPSCGCGWDCIPVSPPGTRRLHRHGRSSGRPNRRRRTWGADRRVGHDGSVHRGIGSPARASEGPGMAPAQGHTRARAHPPAADRQPGIRTFRRSRASEHPPIFPRFRLPSSDGTKNSPRSLLSSRGAGVRLVTLTGPGGTGKTRLAIAAADLLGASRADGVYFVPLATATTADVMWSTMAESLGVTGEGLAPPTFFEHIRSRDMLLILDNLEQLTEAPARGQRAPRARATCLPSSRPLVARCI